MEYNNPAKRVIVRRPQMHYIQGLEWMNGKRAEHSEVDQQFIELPGDVTDLIIATLVKHFTMRDAIRCSVVCKRWLYIASLEAPVMPPWITVIDVLYDRTIEGDHYTICHSLWGKEGSLDQSIHRLSGSPTTICSEPRSTPPRILRLRSYLLASSQGGWLLRGCRCHTLHYYSDGISLSDANLHPISLYNPFTKICFDLLKYVKPVETCCRHGGRQYIKECSVFTHNLYPGYYFVVLSCFSNLSLCRVDGEGKWFHYHNRRHFWYWSLLFRMEEQCLYASDNTGGVDIFTVECHCKNGNQEFHLKPLHFVQVTFSGESADQLMTTNLVEFRGHIIVVICVNNTVELYKLANKDKSCVSRVHSIGEEAFFMGSWGGPSFCVSARGFSKVQQNCIYYHDNSLGHGFTIISLEDGATKCTSYLYVKMSEDDGYGPMSDSKLIAPPPLSSYQHDEF